MKGKEFRRRVKELAAELDMDTAYLNRELGVGFSESLRSVLDAEGPTCDAKNAQ